MLKASILLMLTLCFAAWCDVEGAPLDLVATFSDSELAGFEDEISSLASDVVAKESLVESLSSPKIAVNSAKQVATIAKGIKATAARRLLSTGSCANGLCTFSCGDVGTQANLPGGLGATGAGQCGATNVFVAAGTFNNAVAGDFATQCCVDIASYCGTPALTIKPAQRQQQNAADMSLGPNARIALSIPIAGGSGDVAMTAAGFMTGSLTSPGAGWTATKYSGEFVVPPHKHFKDANGPVTFDLTYTVGGYQCQRPYTANVASLGDVHEIAAYKLDYGVAQARRAYEKEVNGEFLRSQGALRKQVQDGTACAAYVADASKTALGEALDMSNQCQVSSSCGANTDKCDLEQTTVGDANPHLTWCADQGASSSTPATFTGAWQRGFAEAKVASGPAGFLDAHVPNEGNQRGCATSTAGNFLVESKISADSVKYMETTCQSQTNLQGTTAGTRIQTYRKQWGNNATAARQDRAPSIWHKPAESSQLVDGSGEQVVPIDFIITDEQVHSGQCVAGNEGSHLNLQVAESQMTQMDALVCVRDSDQTAFLSADDSYPKISNMFTGLNPDLRFEKYEVSGGILGAAVVDGQASDYLVGSNNQSTVFQKTGPGGDIETCFRIGSMTKAPLCAKAGNECGQTDVFQGEPTHTSGAHTDDQAKRIQDLAASDDYFYGGSAAATEYPSSRLLQASVSEASADIKLRLDGDEQQLVDGPDSTNSAFDSCKYNARIKNPASEAFQVKSKYGLRLRAKAGFQRQIALRFTTYAEFGDITVRSGQLLSHDEATDLGATKGLVGKTLKRVAARTTPGMVVFQPYADGALTGDCDKISGHAQCGVYGQSNMDATIAKREQFHVAAGGLEYYQPVAGQVVWDGATVPDFQAGVTNGHVARYRDTNGALQMSDTVRFDFVIHETTECDAGGKQSSIEQYFYGKSHCDSSDASANKAIAEGKTGRAKFHVSYPAGNKMELIANEYGCGEEGWHHISKQDMDAINTARKQSPQKNWGEVTDALIESLKVQLPTDYSTQMCGDITYRAYVAVYDTRSCGMKLMELGSGGSGYEFMKYQLRTEQSQAATDKYLSTKMDLRGNPATTAQGALSYEQSQAVKVASIAFSPSTARHADGPDKACTPFLAFTAGCADGVSFGQNTTSDTCRFHRQNANVVRADQGTHAFASADKPRDLDYLSSLEVTDLTNLVSWHKYDTSAAAETGGFYSQLQSIIRHDADAETGLDNLPILAERSASTADATFVVVRSFEVNVDGDVTTGENHAADARMSASRQMLGALHQGHAVPSDNAVTGAVNRKVTRYSVFGSVDAFVAASGYSADVFQKCVGCDAIAADPTVGAVVGAIMANAQGANGQLLTAQEKLANFVTACKKSRAAMLGVAVTALTAGGCPATEAAWDASKFVPHNEDLFLLSRAFPAFAPRPGWRDPIRLSVSLDNYEWINLPALQEDGATTLRVTREGLDRFTVLPQCNFGTAHVDENPTDSRCTAHWRDASGSATSSSAANHHVVDEDKDTGDKLYMGIDVAEGHWDGVCARQDSKGKNGYTYDAFVATGTDNLNFEKHAGGNKVKFCKTQAPSCGAGYTCLARAFLWDASGATPAEEKDARINTARLLTYFDKALAAQQETLAAGIRCNRRDITKCIANASKAETCSLASYTGIALDNIGAAQPGHDADQNTFVRQYFGVTDPSATEWLLSQSNQRGSTMMYNKCSQFTAQANTLGDWTSDRHTEQAMQHFFPAHLAGEGPTALSGDTSAFGVYESQQCNAFTPSTSFSTYPSVQHYAATWGDAGQPKLSFGKNFNSVGRSTFMGDNNCGASGDAALNSGFDSLISTGVQFQQTSETQTRAEYRGSHIFVSSCKIDPLTGAAASQGDTIGRNIHVTPSFNDTHHKVENLALNSRTYKVGVSNDAQRFKLTWRDPNSIQEVDTPADGKATTGRDQYLYELDAKNAPKFVTPAQDVVLSSRSDTMVGGIGNTFDSTVLYGDVRPVEMTLDFTYNGHSINDLLEPYTVLTRYGINPDQSKVYSWSKATTKGIYTFDLEQSAIEQSARYQPTAADLAALPSVSEGSFLYTHSTHQPGLQASSFHQEDPVNGVASGYRRIVFKPLQRNLDFRQIKVTATVTSKDSAGTTKVLTQSIEIPVVNVAGQAGICYHKHLTGEAGVVRPSNGFIVGDATNRLCLGEHTDATNSVGDEMAANLATTIAQSSVGSVDSFVPLPIGATSTTFSQTADFAADGTFDGSIHGGTDHQWEISCDEDTTCDYYQERAFLNVYASQPIQLAQQSLVNTASSTNFTRFKPLDYEGTSAIEEAKQIKLIKNWVLDGTLNDAGLAQTDDIADLTKVSYTLGYSSLNNGVMTHTGLGAATVQYEVENPINPVDNDEKWSTLAKGGKLYRLPIAQTTRTCESNGNCKVGFKLDGVHHMNRLFYAAGSEVKENNEIDIHAFITTFSQTSDGTTVPSTPWVQNNNAVMAINAAGLRTRSQAVKWKARVYTTADLGGICVDNVAPIGNFNAIDINYYGKSTSFSPKSEAVLLTKTADVITTDALVDPSKDAHINAGVAIISTKVLEGTNAGFIVEIKDKTAASSGNDWVSLTATRAVKVAADGNSFGDNNNDVSILNSVQIECQETVSEGAGYCADSGTSWAGIASQREARGKIGAGNPSEKFRVSLGNFAAHNAVGGHMMFCFASNFVNHLETRNLVQQCREFCVVAIDPDMQASTTCSAPGCIAGQKAAYAAGSLGSVTCDTTVPANQAKRAGLVAKVDNNAYNKAYLNMAPTGPTDQYLISNRERSHHHDGNAIDLKLNSAGDVGETGSTSAGTGLTSTLGATGGDRLVTTLVQASEDQAKINYETKNSGDILIASNEITTFTGAASPSLTLITSTKGLALESTARVLKSQVASGQMCHGVESSLVAAKSCPAQQTESTDLTGTKTMCKLHRLAFAHSGDYATDRATRACVVSKDASAHDTPAYPGLPVDPVDPVTAAASGACTSIKLTKVGSFEAKDVLRTGLQAASSTASRKADLFPSGTVSDCSGGPGAQRSSLQQCRYSDNAAEKITGKNGLYGFALDDLFVATNNGACTAGAGITIVTEGSDAVSIEGGDNGLFLEGVADTSPDARLLKNHLPFTSGGIMESTSSDSNGFKTTTFTMKQTAVNYLCQLALHRKAIWFELKGKFADTAADRFITVAFVPKTYQGIISLDTSQGYTFDANQLLAASGNELDFIIKREENADAIAMLSHNAFGGMASAYGTSRAAIAGSVADVWVRLKACATGLVSDRLSFYLGGGFTGAMDGGDAVRLATAAESNEVCATRWMHVAAASTSHKLSLDLASRNGGGLAGSKVRLSLCDNIEDQTGCLLIKGEATSPPSADQIHITTVGNENAAIQYDASSLGGESSVGFAADGGIKCGHAASTNKCGLEFSGTCASPQASPGFRQQTSSSLKYTLQLRSSADNQLLDPSGNNIGQVEVLGQNAGDITVVSSHSGLCLEPMSGAANCVGMLQSNCEASSQCHWDGAVCGAGSGSKADADCFVGGALSNIAPSGMDSIVADCRRVLTLTGPAFVKVRARVNLGQSVIDHLYVGRKCTNANSCRSAAVDGGAAALGARIAVVQLPASAPNVAGAHANAIMSQFGMGFDAAPAYDPNTGKISVSFQMGRYRPATNGASSTTNCWVDESQYGVNDLDGHGFALSANQPQTCTEWGDRVTGDGYSPRLMTIGVGEGLQIGKGSDAFSQDHKSAMSCSPMRQIANAWPTGITTTNFAEGLFNPSSLSGGDDGAARATCQTMNSLVTAASTSGAPGGTELADYFGTTKPLAYMKATEAASVQPQWMFNLDTDKSTTVNDAIRCGSRYKILGTMETSLNAASQCHHEDASGNWVKSSTSTTSTLSTGEEIAEVKIPITMRSYTATKARAAGSTAILHNTDAIKTDIVVYTKTSQSFTSVDVNLGRTTDLPRLYTESVVLDSDQSAEKDGNNLPRHLVVNDGSADILVHKGCYEDCQQYEVAGNNNGCGCATRCQVAVTKDGDEIPNAFGRVNVAVTVEIPVADSANGIEAGYVSNLRTFQSIGKAGIGGFNLKSADITSDSNKYEYKTDATHSRVVLTSVYKRLLRVTGNFNTASTSRPSWASSLSGYVAEHNGNEDLLPEADIFKTNAGCPCQANDDNKWPKVEGFSAHAKCTFPNAVDFAFQLQVAKCGGDGVSAAAASGAFNPATNPACGAVAGEFKTVRLYLDYTNGQEFINPEEITEAARNFVLEGERVLASIDAAAAPYSDLTEGRTEADAKLLDGTNPDIVLSAGQPYSLVAEIEDGDRILGSAMRLQQERSLVAVKHSACDPANDCPDGRVLGQCGAKLDSSDRKVAKHALADIVLHDAETANLLPVQGNSATAMNKFDDNAWYKALRSQIRLAPGLPTLAKNSYEVCYGGAPGGFTAKVMNQIPGKWCPRDRLKTAWDPAAEVVDFLSSIAEKSCGQDSLASHIWLCPRSPGNLATSWCYWVSSIADYDNVSSPKSCIVPSSVGLTAAQKQSLFDAFATSFRFLTVVDDFAFQNLEVRQNNLVPYADLGSKSCIQWSGVLGANDAQARYMVPSATGADDCSQLSQLVTTNFESNTVIRGLTPAGSSFPIAGSGIDAARHIQCAASTKSSIFPSSSSDFPKYQHEQGRAIATRNGLRTDITFGSATAIPCVEKMVFMKARITDTRAPGLCHRAKITCSSGGELEVEGLSELKSAEGGSASSGTTYKLLKSTSSNTDNAVGGASASSHPKDGSSTVVPAQLEGWEFEIDGGAVKGSFSGRYKEAGSAKGIRAASGVFELSTNVDSLTSQDKYLYVNTATAAATTVPSGFSAVSCGSSGDDLPFVASDVQLGDAANLSGARRLLTVKTSDSRRYALRRTGGEQQVSVTVTTPAGAAAETFCKTSGIACMPGYVWKASYDTLKCADNNPSNACDHNYCCKEHAGDVHITNNAYHYSNQCNSLADSSTKRRLAFMSGMLIAILAILVLMARAAILFYRSTYCPEGAESNAPCRKPSLVAAAEIVSVLSLILAGIMGLIGQGSDGWIKVCGLDNSADWPVWAPLGMAALLLCYFALPYLHKGHHSEEAARPRRAATSVPMNIL